MATRRGYELVADAVVKTIRELRPLSNDSAVAIGRTVENMGRAFAAQNPRFSLARFVAQSGCITDPNGNVQAPF